MHDEPTFEQEPYVLLESGPTGVPALFRAPRALIVADTAAEVPGALDALARAQAAGHWLAGYAGYELGYALEPRLGRLMPAARTAPLLLFGVFDAPQDATDTLREADAGAAAATLAPPVPGWSAARYSRAFDRLAGWIAAGDCYQANLTFPLTATRTGPVLALFGALRRVQPVGYGALINLGPGPVILSRSPELFFRLSADGMLETRPMKGTIPRGATPQDDAAARAALLASEKDRAENLMIVDLLRNDMARVCTVGSVRVPELFRIESFATLHQMTSRITGQLRPGTGIDAVLRALFPCGSVTGAPKIRAMEIIAELEDTPRDAYCGAIGWIAPGGAAEFSVAIRTMALLLGGQVVMNVGGGVVHDSTAAAEYEEAMWKTRFARIPVLSGPTSA